MRMWMMTSEKVKNGPMLFGEEQLARETKALVFLFFSLFFLEIGSSLFFLPGLETTTQTTNINCPLSVLFCQSK